MQKDKSSFPALFTVICLTVIVGITVSVSALFFIVFRTQSYTQVETNTRENLNYLRDRVIAKFQEWTGLVQHTAIGVAPLMAQQNVDQTAIQQFFQRFLATQTDVVLLYCSNNLAWNEPGSYAVFDNGFIPLPDWKNTQRNWFTAAKKNPGQAGYADPYVDIVTQKLITSVSFVAFDEGGQDLGVVAGDVSIDFLDELLRENAFIPGQTTFFLNKEGLFITHQDTQSVLQKNFFTEFSLDQYRAAILDSLAFSTIDQKWFIYSVAIPEVDWILVSLIPTTFIFSEVSSFLFKIIGVNLLLIALAVAMSIVLTRILQRERDEINAMKDNLKVGFFLMDRSYTIQGQYSRSLEGMLACQDLSGKDFIALLSASFKEREQQAVKDYLTMVFNRSFKQAMLDDINPLHEFQYRGTDGEEKTLSCGFAPVNQRNKKAFILGTVQDITLETALQRKLAQEEQKLQEEMHALFEIIQVDPRVFSDFLEDLEYEFERIHTILEDPGPSSSEAVVNIYQSVHAIKSNALIVGLNSFSTKVHGLESKIKALREQEEIRMEDILGLAIDIEQLMLERDKFRNTIDKIRDFKVSSGGKQYDQVLIESLNRAVGRAAKDTGKQVRLEVERLDVDVLEEIPRRQMKEVLLQLVRNAVYHGIEAPEVREQRGKGREGVIQLGIQREGDKFEIILRDDGVGLNFEKIRERAKDLHIITSAEMEEDRNRLLQVIFAPGFSTAGEEGLYGGRGMGLNLVQDRIRDLGGSIEVQTEAGKGVTFILSALLRQSPKVSAVF
jgi:two-component system chemotaxis sensor kinase CheA